MIGGLVAAVLTSWALGFGGAPSAMDLVVIAIAAFAGGRFLIDVANFIVKDPGSP
jgi:hypothetical protein